MAQGQDETRGSDDNSDGGEKNHQGLGTLVSKTTG